ncbi:MAG: hypothetical protein ABEH78_07920 [Haloferacaceae archaeon]
MSLQTTTDVEELTRVRDDSGGKVPPASDADYVGRLRSADITSGGVDVEPDLPGRAERIVVLVEASAAFSITFEYLDGSGNVDFSRGSAENADLSSSDGSQLYVVHTPADADQVRVNIADDSGGANTATGRVYVA